MTSAPRIYNVLFFEPESVRSELRIARGVLNALTSALQAAVAGSEPEPLAVNTQPYDRLGRIPGTAAEFLTVAAELAPGGIAVCLFNTACRGGVGEFNRLAGALPGLPAVFDATWLVTSSLRKPMAEQFRLLVEKRAGAANPAGSAARRLAVTTGSPCYVPIGDSIVMRAAGEVSATILERIRFLNKLGQERP